MSWISTGDFTMFVYCEPHTDWSGWITMPIWSALIGACDPHRHSATYVVCNEMVQCVCKEMMYVPQHFSSLSDTGI